MGYTTQTSRAMIGLGASSISDIWGAFGQNNKDIEAYKKAVFEGVLPIDKGHILTDMDLFVREQILNLMCNFKTNWTLEQLEIIYTDAWREALEEMEQDGILELQNNGLIVKEKAFVRNICMVFDQYLTKNQKQRSYFLKRFNLM